MEQPPKDRASPGSNNIGRRNVSIPITEATFNMPQGQRANDAPRGRGSNPSPQFSLAGRKRRRSMSSGAFQGQQQSQEPASMPNFGQTQIRAQQRQEINTFMPPSFGPVPRQNFGMAGKRLHADLDMLYFSSGQAEPIQVDANPAPVEQLPNTRRQQPNTFGAPNVPTPDVPASMVQRQRNRPPRQPSMEYGGTRSIAGPNRAEDAIKKLIEQRVQQYRTLTNSVNAQHHARMERNPATIAVLGAEREASQGSPMVGKLHQRRCQPPGQSVEQHSRNAAQIQARRIKSQRATLNGQFQQAPDMRSAGQGLGQSSLSINPSTTLSSRPNSSPAQGIAPREISRASIVAQRMRSISDSFQRATLEATGFNHTQEEHRTYPQDLGSAQNTGSSAHSQYHANESMRPPVTPTSKRDQPHASGSSSQAGFSQLLGPQVPSGSANMETKKSGSDTKAGQSDSSGLQAPGDLPHTLRSLPSFSAVVETSGNLLHQFHNANKGPHSVIHMPGEYIPIPAPLPYAISSPSTQVEQGKGKMVHPQSSSGFKTRITIAISGSVSCGKSTLAYLLATVFEGATMPDTGFAGTQSMYPLFNGRVEEHPNKKGPITKTIILNQSDFLRPIGELPITEWTELYPYSPAMEAMNPQTGSARAFAGDRGNSSYERYWEEAYKANVGIDPNLVFNSSGSNFPRLVPPTPILISKKSPNLDCRGAMDWVQFGRAINEGMKGDKNEEGVFETETGRDAVEYYLAQRRPNSRVPLVNSRKLEPLRERVREWIRKETVQNDRIGFQGRSVIHGSLRQILILDGALLFLKSHREKGAGGEKLMRACDVKLFLPTLEREAIERCLSMEVYMDPPQGTRDPEATWMFEGYLSEVAWREYLSEHGWLFEDGNAVSPLIKISQAAYNHGIHIRDFYTADLAEKGHRHEGKGWSDETLDWAVNAILFQLSVEEAFGRQAFFTKKMSEATLAAGVAQGGVGHEGASDVQQGGAINEVKH